VQAQPVILHLDSMQGKPAGQRTQLAGWLRAVSLFQACPSPD
jgi:hypothetical protein